MAPAVSEPRLTTAPSFLLEVRGVTKRFPGVTALKTVDFNLREGEVHVVFGENGAGKSTLINVIAGTYHPEEGEIYIQGEKLPPLTPATVHRLGIFTVFQEQSLAPNMTVEANLLMGDEPRRLGVLDRGTARQRVANAIATLGIDLPLGVIVGNLSRADQQLVEIAKALHTKPKILILDEPTTTLTEKETNRLFELVDRLRSEGIGIIYITHRMQEISLIGDRITVLRDGRRVETLRVDKAEDDELIRLMTGRQVDALFPKIKKTDGPVKLRLDGVHGELLEDISIHASGGEVVGIAGLVGSGKERLGPLCLGLQRHTGGEIVLGSEPIRPKDGPRVRLARGLLYYPADRRRQGLAGVLPARANITMSALATQTYSRGPFLKGAKEVSDVHRIMGRLNVQPNQPERPVEVFSGGNQQKILFARALTREAELHIFDEPTAGVDVGARVEIYRFIQQLCEDGAAIVLISSDLPEVVNLSHRVYVMSAGRIRRELVAEEITEENVLDAFFRIGSE